MVPNSCPAHGLNGHKLDSVTEQPRQAGEVHISALTHFEITIDDKSEPVTAMVNSCNPT